MLKTCSKCGEEKDLGEFYKDKSSKDGYGYYCKSCAVKKATEWGKKNPEKKRVHCLASYYRAKANPEKHSRILAQRRKRRKANPYPDREYEKKRRLLLKSTATDERIPPKKRCYLCSATKLSEEFNKDRGMKDGLCSLCRDCQKIKNKEYYWAHHEEQKKRIRASHKKRTKQGYNVKKLRESPKLRLYNRISCAIRRTIKDKKRRKWEKLVGYTIEELRVHLESQFQDGMTWGNYGEWHIDHEVPLAVFNFDSPEQIDFKRCWAMENLQPMWAKENLSKGARIEKHFQPMLKLHSA